MACKLTILGAASATPTKNSFPTAQVLTILERFFLIDCGEGTQIQLRRLGIKFQRIDHVFISHLHGDHFFGLIGFLSTLHLLGRSKPMTIYAHEGLKEIIEVQLKHSGTILNYELRFVPLQFEDGQVLYDDGKVWVETVRLKHRVPCCGFIFREHEGKRRLIKEALEEHQVPLSWMVPLKDGKDFEKEDGTIIPNSEFTMAPHHARSYAFCSDTRYLPDLGEKLKGVDVLYHEATFTEEYKDRAIKTLHSTAREAALVAKSAGVDQLLIGHFSVRYLDKEPLLLEAQETFGNVQLTSEGFELTW